MSPNASVPPRYALPRIRPRCCLRYLTFEGINMRKLSYLGRRLPSVLRLVLFAAVDPHLHADLSVGRIGLGEAVIDVRLERVEREATLLVPLGARDLGAVETAGAADLDSLRAEPEGGLDA